MLYPPNEKAPALLTCGQKSEQLFAKHTDEYYYHVQKNMYELIELAADKLGRVVFFDASLSMKDKTEKALKYADLILNVFEETDDDFFIVLAKSFLGRMENDLFFRGGTDEEINAVKEKKLYATRKLTERMNENKPLFSVFSDRV